MQRRKFSLFFEKHIGLGVRWELNFIYALELSISIPFLTVTVVLGAEQ